jgi:hypothetical protein
MITTVSVSTVTTVTTMAAMGLTAIFSMSAGALLLMMLMTKQLTVASGDGFASRLGRFTTVGIAPLLIGFGIIMAFKLFQIMS